MINAPMWRESSEPDVLPGLSAVSRLVDAIAVGDVAAQAGFAGSHVQNVVVGIGHGNRPDRRHISACRTWESKLMPPFVLLNTPPATAPK